MTDDGGGSKKFGAMLGIAGGVIAVLGFLGISTIGDLVPSRPQPIKTEPISTGSIGTRSAAATPVPSQQRAPASAQPAPAPAATGSAEVVGDWSGYGGSGPSDTSLSLAMTLSADGRYAMTLNVALNEEGTYGTDGGTLFFRPRQAAPHAWSYALRQTPTGRALIISNDAFEFALYRA